MLIAGTTLRAVESFQSDGGTAQTTSLREVLRGLRVFADLPEASLDTTGLPESPLRALETELRAAIAADEPEPHAMTLCTVGPLGKPSSRVLLCKDIDDDALYFATSVQSQKFKELEDNPQAAVNFYWRKSGRQFRLVGPTVRQDQSVATADFTARSLDSQAAASVHEKTPPMSFQQVHEAAATLRMAEVSEESLSAQWAVFAILPTEAELWQGRRDRLHQRVQWSRGTPRGTWQHGLLWP